MINKAPFKIYGSKERMIKEILPLIPEHNCYCEPFFGSGTIYFAKRASRMEVINDTNDRLITFYKVLKNDFDNLNKEIDSLLYSRKEFIKAHEIYKNSQNYTDLEIAVSVFILFQMSFINKIGGGWGFAFMNDRSNEKNTQLRKWNNSKERFSSYKNRLEYTYIECDDVINIVKRYDTDTTFFYLDPPYFNSDCGHYGGYSKNDFINLLDTLKKIKGKFLLSSYTSKILDSYKFKQLNFIKDLSCNRNNKNESKTKTTKVEVLSYNYELNQESLFNLFSY